MGLLKNKWVWLAAPLCVVTFLALQDDEDTGRLTDDFRRKSTMSAMDMDELVILHPDREERYTDSEEIKAALAALPQRGSAPHQDAATIQQEKFTDRASLEARLRDLTDHDPIPYELMARLTGSESGFDVNAVSRSGARGLLQLMPATQLELMHDHKNLLPREYRPVAEKIEKYVRNEREWQKDKRNVAPIFGYRVAEGTDAEDVYAAAHDPTVSFILGREYVRTLSGQLRANLSGRLETLVAAMKEKGGFDSQRIAEMQRHRDRPLTYTDIKVGYVLGPTGGAEFLAAYADPEKRNHRALDYADKAAVAGNPVLFYADPAGKKTPRSVEWLYNHFRAKMGTDPLPENLSRPGQTELASGPAQRPEP